MKHWSRRTGKYQDTRQDRKGGKKRKAM